MEKEPTIGILEEFRIEFLDCWHRLPNKAFFFILLVAWLAVFQFFGNSTLGFIKSPSLLYWMYRVYQPTEMGDEGHGYAVPFVVLGLLWWKRKELFSASLQAWSPGLLIVAFALLLHILGFCIQQQRISIVALFLGIYGLCGMAWGSLWLRRTAFPFCLFIFSVPVGTLSQAVTFPLRMLVCRIVEWIAHYVLAIDVIRNGTMLFDASGKYSYDVAAACSGIRSLVAIVGFSFLFGMLTFKTFWRRALMTALAVPLAIVSNVARLLGIVLAAEIGGAKAGNVVHEGGPGGIYALLFYVPALFLLFAVAHWLREPVVQHTSMPAAEELEAQTA